MYCYVVSTRSAQEWDLQNIFAKFQDFLTPDYKEPAPQQQGESPRRIFFIHLLITPPPHPHRQVASLFLSFPWTSKVRHLQGLSLSVVISRPAACETPGGCQRRPSAVISSPAFDAWLCRPSGPDPGPLLSPQPSRGPLGPTFGPMRSSHRVLGLAVIPCCQKESYSSYTRIISQWYFPREAGPRMAGQGMRWNRWFPPYMT